MNSDRRMAMRLVLLLGPPGVALAASGGPVCPPTVPPHAALAVERGDTRARDVWEVVDAKANSQACSVSLRLERRMATLLVSRSGVRLTPAHAPEGHGLYCVWGHAKAAGAALTCWPTDGME